MLRLAARCGAAVTVVQTAKFDTQRILDPQVQGTGYQEGPLYRRHLREYIAAQWSHRCAYCGKGAWEDRTAFELDHVVARSQDGADNVRNLVWSCRPCNQQKGDLPVKVFLAENPERRTDVLRQHRPPLAAAGQHAVICKALGERLETGGLKTTETSGADTAHARDVNGIAKSHTGDAACCKAQGAVTHLRQPVQLKSIGHGRRKQIKSLPVGPYLRWRHRKPAERRAAPCPGHAHHPNHVHGIRSGDRVRILTKTGWRNGTTSVEAARRRIHVRGNKQTFSTSKQAAVKKIAPRSGYATAIQS